MRRFWQWHPFIGLLLWVTLVGSALWPVLRGPMTEIRTVVGLLFLSTVCIGLFFASALIRGARTHISEMEYCRRWLIHLWVEGFFRVLAAPVMTLLVHLRLVRATSASTAVLFATVIFSGQVKHSARWQRWGLGLFLGGVGERTG